MISDLRLRQNTKILTKSFQIQRQININMHLLHEVLYGLPDTLQRKLQSVQNATARLITGTRRSDHISLVLHELHWLFLQPRNPDITYRLFRRQLKGHLFREA